MTIEEIKNQIFTNFPEIDFIDKSDHEHLRLEFKSKFQKEYKYYIYYWNINRHSGIGAQLLNSKDNEVFWYYPFEPYMSKNPEEQKEYCEEFLLDELKILNKHQTRITQKNKWFFQSFLCEYLEDGKWTRYYSLSFMKTKFRLPKIDGKIKIYT